MKIEITADNVLIGDVNYVAGDVLEYAAPDSVKKHLVDAGKAKYSDESASSDPEGFKAKHLPAVEDKATITHPIEGVSGLLGPDDSALGAPLVTAESEVTADGKPVPVKVKPAKKD